MTHRILSVKPLENFVVSVVFQNGIEKKYDIKKLYSMFPQFRRFESIEGLFESVKADVGGYGISWNDELDLDAEELWNEGKDTGIKYEPSVIEALGANLTQARERVGMTQKQLAEKVGMYQADVSKIERGLANPSVQTLQRLAEGMNLKLSIK